MAGAAGLGQRRTVRPPRTRTPAPPSRAAPRRSCRIRPPARPGSGTGFPCAPAGLSPPTSLPARRGRGGSGTSTVRAFGHLPQAGDRPAVNGLRVSRRGAAGGLVEARCQCRPSGRDPVTCRGRGKRHLGGPDRGRGSPEASVRIPVGDMNSCQTSVPAAGGSSSSLMATMPSKRIVPAGRHRSRSRPRIRLPARPRGPWPSPRRPVDEHDTVLDEVGSARPILDQVRVTQFHREPAAADDADGGRIGLDRDGAAPPVTRAAAPRPSPSATARA